jgi:hypothetical protein
VDDLRTELKDAFAGEQAGLGDVAGTPERLVRGALDNRDAQGSRRVQFGASVAAGLIAITVITTFAYVRSGIGTARPGLPVASPSPSASPTPLATPLSVPDGTPVILYHDPANFDQVDGMTWDGSKSGRVGAGVANGGFSNPYGNLYATTSDIRDRAGRVVGTLDSSKGSAVASLAWADDGRHYCILVRTGSPDVSSAGELQLAAPGEKPFPVARVGTFAPDTQNGGEPNVVACSIERDTAVVVQAGGQGVTVAEFWVLQLSTGRVIWQGGAGRSIAASRDGQYVAVNESSPTSVIYGPNGAVVARLNSWVFAFSWDGSLAVTSSSSTGSPVVVSRWGDGTVVWSGPSDQGHSFWTSLAEPGGTRLAIGILDPAYPQTTGFAPVDLYVVSADGSVIVRKDNVYLYF